MIRKQMAVLLSVILLMGCGTKKPTEETNTSPGTESDSAVSNVQNTEITVRTETIGEVSFDISSLWTREDQNGAACYYRYFDKAGNYEAFILVDANTANYGNFKSRAEALEYIAKQSIPEGATVTFSNPIEVGSAEGYQVEFDTDTDAGARVCDMMIIAGPSQVTRMMFSQLKKGDVDYGTEFEEIWDTVRIAADPSFSTEDSQAPVFSSGKMVYEQSDYTLKCYEQNDGTVACDAMLEIHNTGDVPIWLNDDTYFDIYNESGSIIASCSKGNIDLIPEVILPGEYGYYVTRKGIELPGGYFTGYEYELGGEIRPQEAKGTPHDYPVEIVSVNDENGKPSALGYVTNDTDHDYPNIQLYIVYYDNDERAECAAHDYIGKLSPGTRQPFSLGGKLTFDSANISTISSYDVFAREAYNPE